MSDKRILFAASALWLLAAGFNLLNERAKPAIIFNIFIAALFLFLGICQHICDKNGNSGKNIMKKINIGALILVIILTTAIFFYYL